jgi:hypothetical protein
MQPSQSYYDRATADAASFSVWASQVRSYAHWYNDMYSRTISGSEEGRSDGADKRLRYPRQTLPLACSSVLTDQIIFKIFARCVATVL